MNGDPAALGTLMDTSTIMIWSHVVGMIRAGVLLSWLRWLLVVVADVEPLAADAVLVELVTLVGFGVDRVVLLTECWPPVCVVDGVANREVLSHTETLLRCAAVLVLFDIGAIVELVMVGVVRCTNVLR